MKLILSDFITLDGVIQAPGGAQEDTDGGFAHGGWSMPYFDPATMGPAIDALMAETSALLFGRRTWETMAAAWPARAGEPFADRMNAIEKYVVSGTLNADDPGWSNTQVLSPDTWVEEVSELRRDGEGALQVMGSSQLARALITAEMVDEYRLMVNPVVVGGGKRLFPDDGKIRQLDLVEAVATATGVVMCTYRPAADRGERSSSA